MTVIVVPITESPAVVPAPSPGQMLSARERGVADFREKVARELHSTGPKRSADHMLGYRHGWDAAVAWLRMSGAIR